MSNNKSQQKELWGGDRHGKDDHSNAKVDERTDRATPKTGYTVPATDPATHGAAKDHRGEGYTDCSVNSANRSTDHPPE